MSDDVDYWYLWEKPLLVYQVRVTNPPADLARADFHKNAHNGPVFFTDTNLVRQGQGKILFDIAARGLTLEDSPIFVEFTFAKYGRINKHMVVLSLAEPVVRAIDAPPETDPGEPTRLVVTAWDARAYDLPRLPTQFEERDPARIPDFIRAQVRWQLESKDLAERGEAITTRVAKEHLGSWVTAEAFLGEKPPAPSARVAAVSNRLTRTRLHKSKAQPARARIAVPRLTVEGRDEVMVGEQVVLEAKIEPEIAGAFAWSPDHDDPKKISWQRVDSPGLQVTGLARGELSVPIAFTSQATGKEYRAEHPLRVKTLAPRLAVELEKHPRLLSSKVIGKLTLRGPGGWSQSVGLGTGKDLDPGFTTIFFTGVEAGKTYSLHAKPANGGPEYVAMREREIEEDLLSTAENPPRKLRLAIPRLVWADHDTEPVAEKHVYVDLALPAAKHPLVHARTDWNGNLCAVKGANESPSHPIWLDVARASVTLHVSDGPVDRSHELVLDECARGAVVERASPPTSRGGEPAERPGAKSSTGAPREREHVVKVERLRATLPIRLSFPGADRTTAWLRDNPIEVKVDGCRVSSRAHVSAPGRVLVEFDVLPGKHGLVISSLAGPADRRLRIIHLSQQLTVKGAGATP